MPRSAGHFSYLNQMKWHQHTIAAGVFFCLLAGCAGHNKNGEDPIQATDKQTGWALLPFEKLDSVNPVLQPGEGVFFCPIRKDTVQWEEKDVFNPATVVRNDTL